MPRLRPFQIRIREIARLLSIAYPSTTLGNRVDPLEEAVFIILTTQTNERNYFPTWESFTAAFPKMHMLAHATEEDIYRAIRTGGLGRWKAKRIYNLLHTVLDNYHELSLSSLTPFDNLNLEKRLLELDGIGIKTARCIMMYSFKRKVFPIDTHCARILSRIGIPKVSMSPRSKSYANYIQNRIPADLRLKLHINLIQHGRSVCTPHPKCDQCVISHLCSRFSSKGRTNPALDS